LKSQEGELGKCHASDYSEIHRFAQFTITAGAIAQQSLNDRSTIGRQASNLTGM
jgi:hypothetical protein